jgi:hypothetical protein
VTPCMSASCSGSILFHGLQMNSTKATLAPPRHPALDMPAIPVPACAPLSVSLGVVLGVWHLCWWHDGQLPVVQE